MARKPPGTHEPRARRVSARKRLLAKARAGEFDNMPTGPLPSVAPTSPLADWLMDKTPETERRMLVAAALGKLTSADLMAAFVAEMGELADVMERGELERCYRATVMRCRLLAAIAKNVRPTVSSGAVQSWSIAWPEDRADDRGEDVRLEVPD